MYTQNPSPLRFSSNFVESLIWPYYGDMQILKKIGSLLGPLWADLRESLKKYPKSRKNRHNFPTALVPSIIIFQIFFHIKIKIWVSSIWWILKFCKKIFFLGLYRVSNYFGHFRLAIFEAEYLKTPQPRFSWKFVKILEKAQLRNYFFGSFILFEFLWAKKLKMWKNVKIS